MTISKMELDDFCEELQKLEEIKKDAAADMKSSIERLSENLDKTPKAIKKFYKEWKEAQKDKDDYILTDFESDELLQIAFPEFATTA